MIKEFGQARTKLLISMIVTMIAVVMQLRSFLLCCTPGLAVPYGQRNMRLTLSIETSSLLLESLALMLASFHAEMTLQ